MKEEQEKFTFRLLTAFQDQIYDNLCFGCGPSNPIELRIKSYWSVRKRIDLYLRHDEYHNAGPDVFVNGGIIATIIDFHSVCTAIADTYRREGREVGTGESIWFAIGSLSVKYFHPTPIDTPAV